MAKKEGLLVFHYVVTAGMFPVSARREPFRTRDSCREAVVDDIDNYFYCNFSVFSRKKAETYHHNHPPT